MSAEATARPTPHAELARNLLRERVLDVVAELLRDRPWAKVTMADVAAGAGVSRQTLYNAFGSRSELAEAYVSREADRFLAAVEVAVRENAEEPHRALAAALEVFLAAAGEHQLVRAITSADGAEELLPLVTTRGGPLLSQVTERLAGLLLDTWSALDRRDAALVADVLVRLAISYAALPAGDSAKTAAELSRLLTPSVNELLG